MIKSVSERCSCAGGKVESGGVEERRRWRPK